MTDVIDILGGEALDNATLCRTSVEYAKISTNGYSYFSNNHIMSAIVTIYLIELAI